jgi:anaerobic selenocysteine-containing dehydrogenase
VEDNLGDKQIFSICGMCTVRCPIQVEVASNRVKFIQGNPYAAGLEGSLCARGGAGAALIEDKERPQYPLICTGKRGEGEVAPGPGQFRLTFGRCALHTQGHTVNNPLLSEQMPENVLWINRQKAEALKINDGDEVEVGSNGHRGRIRAKVTDLIHSDAVFMVHGFGPTLPVESRALGQGVSDSALMPGGLALWDPAGGGMALQEHFVTVTKIKPV